MELISAEKREELEAFLKTEDLPDPLDNSFVLALKEVLSGLIKVDLSMRKLKKELQLVSGSSTPSGIKKRFEDYIDGLTRGKDQDKVRIVLGD